MTNMTKKWPIIISIIYIFVIQAIIIGLLRNEPRRHILGGINFIATILLALLRKQSKQRSEQKWEAPLIREKHPTPKETGEKDFFTKEKKEESSPTLSESNIEYIKTRINRNRKNQTSSTSLQYSSELSEWWSQSWSFSELLNCERDQFFLHYISSFFSFLDVEGSQHLFSEVNMKK